MDNLPDACELRKSRIRNALAGRIDDRREDSMNRSLANRIPSRLGAIAKGLAWLPVVLFLLAACNNGQGTGPGY
jgi:hypothetical protein